jgi:large subunit ribosomal protein L21
MTLAVLDRGALRYINPALWPAIGVGRHIFMTPAQKRNNVMHAVIRTGGKQYRVAADDVIKVEKLSGEAGDVIVFDEVLALGGDAESAIGTPLIDGASVAARVIAQDRADKVIIFKKRRRHTYRRRQGHRQYLTILRIEEILTGGKKPTAKSEPKKVEAKDDSEKPAEKKTADKKPAAAKADDKKPAAKDAKDTKDSGETKPMFKAPAGEPDDLKKISGVGPVLEKKLNALGITKYAQVAAFTKEEIDRVDDELNFKGRIERDDWLSQAATLAKESDS